MAAKTEPVFLTIPNQKTSPTPVVEEEPSVEENCGHWLGFWYGWWVCWWAGFFIISVPISFIFSFLGRKLCCLILKASRHLCSCPLKLKFSSSIIKGLEKQEANNAEDLLGWIKKWKNLMPGIILGAVIGIFQIVNCMMYQYQVGGAIFGIIFGFQLMVLNAYILKL